jgi:hypothetical protein
VTRAWPVILLALITCAMWTAVSAARAKPFWHDEIYTILVSDLGSAATIWAAHRDAVDLQPPLTTFVTRAVRACAGTGPVTMRLPAMVGFCTMICVVFELVRIRAGTTLALAAALVPFQTAAFRYSYEARAYGLMIGLTAVAVLAWTNAAAGRGRRLWIPVLAISLAAATWAHYYAAFTFVVIGAGEAVRMLCVRRIDRSIWAAIVTAAAMVLPLVSLTRVASAQSGGFWAAASSADIADTYAFLLQPFLSELWSRWGVLAAVIIGVAAAARYLRGSRLNSGRDATRTPLAAHEVVAFASLLLLPAAMVLLAPLVGGFTPRYGLSAVVALALLVPLVAARLTPDAEVARGLLCLMLLVPFAQLSFASVFEPPPARPNPFEERPLLAAALTRESVVVAGGSLTFLQLWYYTPALLRSRLTYLADPDSALRFIGTDTFDRGYLALARWTRIPTQRYRPFLAAHRQFIVYSAGSGWLLRALREKGARVELIASEPGGQQYRVQLPDE